VTTTPHDALLKAVYSAPPRTTEPLGSPLPPALVAAIAWNTLALQRGSFVDAEQRARRRPGGGVDSLTDRFVVASSLDEVFEPH
jgi:hypothetical protein